MHICSHWAEREVVRAKLNSPSSNWHFCLRFLEKRGAKNNHPFLEAELRRVEAHHCRVWPRRQFSLFFFSWVEEIKKNELFHQKAATTPAPFFTWTEEALCYSTCFVCARSQVHSLSSRSRSGNVLSATPEDCGEPHWANGLSLRQCPKRMDQGCQT